MPHSLWIVACKRIFSTLLIILSQKHLRLLRHPVMQFQNKKINYITAEYRAVGTYFLNSVVLYSTQLNVLFWFAYIKTYIGHRTRRRALCIASYNFLQFQFLTSLVACIYSVFLTCQTETALRDTIHGISHVLHANNFINLKTAFFYMIFCFS